MKNKVAETKTHLEAGFATCSCPFPGQGLGQGWLLEGGENSRGTPVGEAGSLCFATGSGGQASGGKKSESIWSWSCRKLEAVPAASLHLRPDTCEVPGAFRGSGGGSRHGVAWRGVSRGEEASGPSPRIHGQELGIHHLCASLLTSIPPGYFPLLYFWEMKMFLHWIGVLVTQLNEFTRNHQTLRNKQNPDGEGRWPRNAYNLSG